MSPKCRERTLLSGHSQRVALKALGSGQLLPFLGELWYTFKSRFRRDGASPSHRPRAACRPLLGAMMCATEATFKPRTAPSRDRKRERWLPQIAEQSGG